MDSAKLKLLEEYGIDTLQATEALMGVKYAKPQITPTHEPTIEENVKMVIEKTHEVKNNISQETMERDYFKFCSMGYNAHYIILKKIIDKYTVEEVKQAILDLRELHSKNHRRIVTRLDPETVGGILMIPRMTLLIESYNDSRVEKQKMKNGNVQKDKRYFAVTITSPHKVPVSDAETFINKYAKSKTFGDYVYCLEHIHENIHCHLCIKLEDSVQCLKPKKFLDKFNTYAEKHNKYKWTMQLLDSSGKPHYWAKTWNQCANFVRYITKYETDKQIYLKECLIRQYSLNYNCKDYSQDDFEKLSHYMEKGCLQDVDIKDEDD